MHSKIEEIPVKAIQGNKVLAISVGTRELERCEKAIREYGLIQPLVVRRCEEGHYQVISGECERMVVTRMRQNKIQAVVLECLEQREATRLALLLSSLKQSHNALSEGLLLKELCEDGKHTQTEIALLVGRSISWVNKRLALAERLAVSVVELVRAGQLCSHTAQEIARMPSNVQQPFANKVIRERLPKSAVERLVTTYNRSETPSEMKKAILENPEATLGWLNEVEKPRGPKPQTDSSPTSLSLQKLRNVLSMLFKLTGEAEGLLAVLPAEDRRVVSPMLLQCTQSLWRFAQLVKSGWGDFSPGKKDFEEV
jgi:ParB family chromosome partitioning protein